MIQGGESRDRGGGGRDRGEGGGGWTSGVSSRGIPSMADKDGSVGRKPSAP